MTADRVAQDALDRALDEKEDLLLVYQPIHDSRSREIVAVEALLRQRRESGELRETSIITETAERGPEVFQLDSHTTRKAFTDAAKWMSQNESVRLNINLSPREFQEKDIVERLKTFAAGCRTNLGRINLEMTEMSYIEDVEQTARVLDDLKKLGLQLWLDDFGTGHSSMTHLQLFPLEGIKIPATFIKEVPGDARCNAITRSLIALAHDLELQVIAEGIEHEEQLRFLLDHDCDYIQGFLFSKPMELEEFEALLTVHR